MAHSVTALQGLALLAQEAIAVLQGDVYNSPISVLLFCISRMYILDHSYLITFFLYKKD